MKQQFEGESETEYKVCFNLHICKMSDSYVEKELESLNNRSRETSESFGPGDKLE